MCGMFYGGILMSITLRREQIVKLRNSPEFLKLHDYYLQKTMFRILKIDRREDTHSDFLAWILNPSESHDLGIYPINKLLETIILVLNKGPNKNNNNVSFPNDWIDIIIMGKYEIFNVGVTREKFIDRINSSSSGRIDIFIEFDIRRNQDNGNKEKHFRLIIENKVNSKEHDKQTEVYFEWACNTASKEVVDIFIFLTPLSNLEYEALAEPECACKSFVQLNYQYLVDRLLKPCIMQHISSDTKFFINQYIRSLSYPAIMEFGDEQNKKGDLIMAMSEDEQILLTNFWEANKELLLATIKATIDNPDVELEDEERDIMEKAVDVLSKTTKTKDKTEFEFYGSKLKSKADFVYAVVKKYINENQDITYEKLIKVFPDEIQGKYGVLRSKDKISPKDITNNTRKRYDPSRSIITADGVEAFICTQWGADQNTKDGIPGSSIYKFIAKVRELGYEFTPMGDYPLANFLRWE